VPKKRRPPAEVFLNVPYDRKFENLFLAYIAGISAFGLAPRATLEIRTSQRRLEKIRNLIALCGYSIHDLSRVELDASAPRVPRFNMPFELGLAVAHQMTSGTGHEPKPRGRTARADPSRAGMRRIRDDSATRGKAPT
jgi:hypothetical protein